MKERSIGNIEKKGKNKNMIEKESESHTEFLASMLAPFSNNNFTILSLP